jgi:L-ribulokinase
MKKKTNTFALGIDYGTNSVRALVVRVADGTEVGCAVSNYPSGNQGVLIDPKNDLVARQSPRDHEECLVKCVKAALAAAKKGGKFDASDIIGIGVDSTGSSPIPVDARNRPLAFMPRFAKNPAAQCWLWKDHTSWPEAEAITRLAALHRPGYLAKCGGVYSSEWFWSKIWRCLKDAPEVFAAAHSWVELCDWIPAMLAGITDPTQVRRGVCAAGHKAMYSEEWGGLPDKEFLSLLDPKLAALRDRLYSEAHDATREAGRLCPEWAARLGLPAGIPIAIGAFDVHYGAIGCGVREGVLVKIIGTSTCDCAVVSAKTKVADIPGICGIVPGAILPGFHGIEVGQSAVGDMSRWIGTTATGPFW